MTEALFWEVIPQPVIAAITMLAFVPGSWKVRISWAVIAFVVNLGLGLFVEWLKSQGVPGWVGWFIALPLAGFVLWHWWRAQKKRPV